MKRVTAETITDGEIRDLMSLGDTPLTGNGFIRTCKAALEPEHDVCHAGGMMLNASRFAARERCAAVWNARAERIAENHDVETLDMDPEDKP